MSSIGNRPSINAGNAVEFVFIKGASTLYPASDQNMYNFWEPPSMDPQSDEERYTSCWYPHFQQEQQRYQQQQQQLQQEQQAHKMHQQWQQRVRDIERERQIRDGCRQCGRKGHEYALGFSCPRD